MLENVCVPKKSEEYISFLHDTVIYGRGSKIEKGVRSHFTYSGSLNGKVFQFHTRAVYICRPILLERNKEDKLKKGGIPDPRIDNKTLPF